jgi:hypothetical protein
MLGAFIMIVGYSAMAPDLVPWNFTIGRGVGFPQENSAHFVNNGADFVVGGGPNVRRCSEWTAEFMWHDLPDQAEHPSRPERARRRCADLSRDTQRIVPIPSPGKLGLYAIGDGGWYHPAEVAWGSPISPRSHSPGVHGPASIDGRGALVSWNYLHSTQPDTKRLMF